MDKVGYPVSERALEKWAREKICLLEQAGETYHFVFPFEGSTCKNGGNHFHADIHAVCTVKDKNIQFRKGWFDLSPNEPEVIKEMCGFLRYGDGFFDILKKSPPFAGKKVSKVVKVSLPVNAAGCLCDEAMRNHKWIWVLSTIHYAFVHELGFRSCPK